MIVKCVQSNETSPRLSIFYVLLIRTDSRLGADEKYTCMLPVGFNYFSSQPWQWRWATHANDTSE